jgi:hypothetical protein
MNQLYQNKEIKDIRKHPEEGGTKGRCNLRKARIFKKKQL